MSVKKEKSLNWEDFQKLGDPENAPEEKEEKDLKSDHYISISQIRVHLEKKGRGGKSVSIIRGLKMTDTMMKKYAGELKSFCGTGGSQKNGEIIIQGDQRDKIIDFFRSKGARDIKKSGG